MSSHGRAVLLVGEPGGRTRALLESVYGDQLRIADARDHESALDAVRRHECDVALITERPDPRCALEFVRSAARIDRALPVVLLAGDGGRGTRQAALAAGAADCVSEREIDADALERVVEGAIRLWRSETALRASEERYRVLADEALRVSEERFRGAFDSAVIGMAIVAPDGAFLEVNGSLCTFTGYTEAELLTRGFQSITHPNDLGTDLAARARLLRGEIRSYQLEKRYIHKDGSELWGLLCVSLVRDAQGEPLYSVGQVQNITPRKQADVSIAHLLERLKRLRLLDQAILSAVSPREIATAALAHLARLVPCCRGRVSRVGRRGGRGVVLATLGAPTAPVDGDPAAAEPTDALKVQPYTPAVAHVRTPLTYQGRSLGSLDLYFDRAGAPTPEHLDVARQVADLVAIALRQAGLFRQVRRGKHRLSVLSHRLIAAQEAERRRLARELHDEIGQSLTVLKLGIQAGAETDSPSRRQGFADDGVQLVDILIDQVRSLSLDLRPSMLDDFGLPSALRWYVDRLARRSGIEARLTADPPDARAPAAIETACFRIAQEALTNVVRHASARHVWVDLRRDGDELSMTVRDDGAGFDLAHARERAARGSGLGLLGMRERAALLGGRIEIVSAPGHGTSIRVTIPPGTSGAEAPR